MFPDGVFPAGVFPNGVFPPDTSGSSGAGTIIPRLSLGIAIGIGK